MASSESNMQFDPEKRQELFLSFHIVSMHGVYIFSYADATYQKVVTYFIEKLQHEYSDKYSATQIKSIGIIFCLIYLHRKYLSVL